MSENRRPRGDFFDSHCMHNHVMHRLLPPKKRLQYKLRPRDHNLVLTCRTSYYDSCNFVTRMIISDAYWLYIYFYYCMLYFAV